MKIRSGGARMGAESVSSVLETPVARTGLRAEEGVRNGWVCFEDRALRIC